MIGLECDDDSGDELEEVQRQALERPAPVPGEDLSAPPMDGMQYLRRVIEETKRCQAVVVAEDVKRKHQRTANVPYVPEPASCDKSLLPDKEWQLSAISDFSDLRLNLGPLRERLTGTGKGAALLDLLPLIDDDAGWLMVVKQQNPDLSSDSPGPSTSLCLALPQSHLYELLGMMADWLSDGDVDTVPACRWAYCLLACLEPPFSSSVYSRLRQISRALINHRAQLASMEDEELPHINLLVCIIGRYFNQVDLADPYPDG